LATRMLAAMTALHEWFDVREQAETLPTGLGDL
jgi:hypothetical protein